MKVIFLDIDGVLNSYAYDRIRSMDDGIIDKTRLPILKEIVDATAAVVVLSSTWKRHWNKDICKCSFIGKELIEAFALADIEIYDKTPDFGSRKDEINEWIKNNGDVEKFVILDDIVFGWDELSDHVVRTDARIGRGLEEHHKKAAIAILNG